MEDMLVNGRISKALMERKGEEIDPNLILPIDSAARGMYVIAQTV